MAFKQFLTTFIIIILLINFDTIHSQSHVSLTSSSGICPLNYELRNGLCYSDMNSNLSRCPPEYFLYTDGLCYPKERKPCPADEVTKTPVYSTTANMPTFTATSSTTTPYPIEMKRLICPTGSIMYRNKCSKVICNLGEYYRGSCHRAICPSGLVWRGKQCKKPGFVTTIIEIDNTFVNQINRKAFALEISEHNEIINHTTTEVPITTTSYPALLKIKATPVGTRSHLTTTTKSSDIDNLKINETCCLVISPRICKKYLKWQCFNRKYNICDNRICIAPVLYLKAPEIKYEPPILVMPPNPQLDACKNTTCNTDTDIVDCSGCSNRNTENCSSYCYAYNCSNETCTFINLKDYCIYYPGQNGCMKKDGCLWNWCSKSK